MPDRKDGLIASLKNLIPHGPEVPASSTVDSSIAADRLIAAGASPSGISFPSEAVSLVSGSLLLPDNRLIQIGNCWVIPESRRNNGRRVGYIVGPEHKGQRTVHIRTGATETPNPKAIILVTYAENGTVDSISITPLSMGVKAQDNDGVLKTIDLGKQGFIDPGVVNRGGNIAQRGMFVVDNQKYEVLLADGITDKATKTRLSLVVRLLNGRS